MRFRLLPKIAVVVLDVMGAVSLTRCTHVTLSFQE